MLTLGIDDAGRGPLIGPMILAGALMDGNIERKLKKEGIRDSKVLSQSERIRMDKIIKGSAFEYFIAKTFPDEIDTSLLEGTNLNTLEAMKTAKIINSINKGKYRKEKIKVVVDCPSVNTAAWRETLIGFIEHAKNLEVVCEHKADVNHVSAAAGSILAKTTREEEVDKIKKDFGEIGSGYPSDPVTKNFLKERGNELKDSGIFRKTWRTWKKMFPGREQSVLDDF